jgi:nucleotide-binding universal stress UspA family protein
VHVLNVTPAVLHLAGDRSISTRELAESDREEIWRRATPALERADVEVVEVNLDGAAGEVLCGYSEQIGASVLVVGPRGRGRLRDALLGSTAHTVVRDSTCDVLVVKR